MARREFTKATKRLAWERSGGRCEGEGQLYGLPKGLRCDASLGAGVEYDHIDLDANSKDNSLENCAAVCPACHRYKTSKIDVPKAAKTKRQQDKNRGIRKPKGRPMPGSKASGIRKRMDGSVERW